MNQQNGKQDEQLSGLAYHLRNKPGQRRVVESIQGFAEGVNKRRKKIKVPRPTTPVRTAPPAAAPAAPAAPAASDTLPYVMQEIDKMAAEGLLPPGAPDRIRAKIAQQQKTAIPNPLRALGIGKPMSVADLKALAGNRLQPKEVETLHGALHKGERRSLLSRDAAERAIQRATNASGDQSTFQKHTDKLMDTDPTARRLGIIGGVGAGALVADTTYNAAMQQHNYNKMLRDNPELQDNGSTRQRFRTLTRFSPDMAADSYVAGSAVKKMVEFGDIDPATLKNLKDNQREPRSLVPRLLDTFAQAAGLSV